MDIIKRASYFSLCEKCGLHGHIVCTDDAESTEFGTISKGLKILAALVLGGRIAKDEALEVRHQIEESKLELRNSETDETMAALLRMRGRMKEDFRELFDEIHREMRSDGVLAKEPNGAKRTLH